MNIDNFKKAADGASAAAANLAAERNKVRGEIHKLLKEKKEIGIPVPEDASKSEIAGLVHEADTDIRFFDDEKEASAYGLVRRLKRDGRDGSSIVEGLVLDESGELTDEEFSVRLERVEDPENLTFFIVENCK